MNCSIMCAVFAVLNIFLKMARLVTYEKLKATGYDRLSDIEKYFIKNGIRFFIWQNGDLYND